MEAMRIILCIVMGGISVSALAQTSLDPGQKKDVYSPQHVRKVVKVKKRKVQHTPEYEFYDRIERVAKEKKKLFKRYYKDQYMDPRYFGHKSIPKRRSANKMRYCEECGIRH